MRLSSLEPAVALFNSNCFESYFRAASFLGFLSMRVMLLSIEGLVLSLEALMMGSRLDCIEADKWLLIIPPTSMSISNSFMLPV